LPALSQYKNLPLALSISLPVCLWWRLGVTESAHKATEMKILTSKCTAATTTAAMPHSNNNNGKQNYS